MTLIFDFKLFFCVVIPSIIPSPLLKASTIDSGEPCASEKEANDHTPYLGLGDATFYAPVVT